MIAVLTQWSFRKGCLFSLMEVADPAQTAPNCLTRKRLKPFSTALLIGWHAPTKTFSPEGSAPGLTANYRRGSVNLPSQTVNICLKIFTSSDHYDLLGCGVGLTDASTLFISREDPLLSIVNDAVDIMSHTAFLFVCLSTGTAWSRLDNF